MVGVGAVRVAVDQPRHAGLAHRRLDLGRRHVHDLHGLGGLAGLAGGARLADEVLARGQRLAEELRLECRVAHVTAELHVVEVLRAPGVAMGQQHLRLSDLRHRGVGQQHGAGALAERAAQQQVAVAVHQVDAQAGVGQTAKLRGHVLADGVIVVVAGPVLEQIAEDHQLGMARRDLGHEAIERRQRGRQRRVQVQVGDEDRRRQRDAVGLSRLCRHRVGGLAHAITRRVRPARSPRRSRARPDACRCAWCARP